jgi:K+-transporting ATPase c subunit
MTNTEQTIPELANEMQAFYIQVERLEREGSSIDSQISRLSDSRTEVSRIIGSVKKRHIKSAVKWTRLVDKAHSDPLYPFVVNGTNDNDYQVVGGELLEQLHTDIDYFHAFTDQIEDPAPIYAMTGASGYVGYVAPGTRAVVHDNSELFIPIDNGIKFPGHSRRENLTEAETTSAISLHSKYVSLKGLQKVLHYGEDATLSWQELLLRRGKGSFEQWLAIKATSNTGDLNWLTPPKEAVERWKRFVHSSVSIILTGRYGGADSKIALAEHALTLSELDYNTDERTSLVEIIRLAKLRENML